MAKDVYLMDSIGLLSTCPALSKSVNLPTSHPLEISLFLHLFQDIPEVNYPQYAITPFECS